MRTLEQKIAETEAKHQAELDTLRMLEQARLAAAELTDRAPAKIHQFTSYADAVVQYDAESIQDALELAERLEPSTIFRVRSGTVALKPTVSEQDEERAEIETIGPWYLRAATTRPYATDWALHLFNPGDPALEIRIKIPDEAMRADGYAVKYSYKHPSKYQPDGEVIHCRIEYPRDHFTKAHKYWAPVHQPNDYVLV